MGFGFELVSERLFWSNGTLGDESHSVHPWGVCHVHSVTMDRYSVCQEVVAHMQDDLEKIGTNYALTNYHFLWMFHAKCCDSFSPHC